jgi:hypothetical protein
MGDAHLLDVEAKVIEQSKAISSNPPQTQPQPQPQPQPRPQTQPQTSRDTELASADKAAVDATNNASMTWKEAHEQWLSRTQRELSPGAFGRRILAHGGGHNPKAIAAPLNVAICVRQAGAINTAASTSTSS